MKASEFAVSRFKNRNGVTSYRVDGRLHGVRIRKTYRTRELRTHLARLSASR